jgi:hypothetical protein
VTRFSFEVLHIHAVDHNMHRFHIRLGPLNQIPRSLASSSSARLAVAARPAVSMSPMGTASPRTLGCGEVSTGESASSSRSAMAVRGSVVVIRCGDTGPQPRLEPTEQLGAAYARCMASGTSDHEPVLETKLKGDLTRELADLASLWADFQLVEMSLHARKKLNRRSEVFARRALWEQAVIAYGRCFNTGTRQKLPDQLKAQMVGGSLRVHDEVLRLRNKHVAHRVDKDEWTRISLTYPKGQPDANSVRVRVGVPTGPEDERLIEALAELVSSLKNRLWEQWFPRLEAAILEKHGSDAAVRAKAAVFEVPNRPGELVITMNLSGRDRDL